MIIPKCEKCESIWVEAIGDNSLGIMHQKICELAKTGDDADKMRTLARKVEIGTWTDQLGAIFPRAEMIENPEVVGKDTTLEGTNYAGSVIVLWKYPGITFTLARGLGRYKGKELSVYAVQKMEFNNLTRNAKKAKKNVTKYK